jgi:glycerol-3-phosphate dehydrogenase
MYPVAWGETLVENQFTSWLYNGVCGINQMVEKRDVTQNKD